MRRVLILGGTGWLGGDIARAAIVDGAEVVCLARGESGSVPEGARFIEADRTHAGAYDALEGEWDEVIELANEPELVDSALEALSGRAGHWTVVSTVSVYRRNDEPGADESADVVHPEDPSDYAHAKVLAERATAAQLADKLLVVRPGLIAGPGDPSDRFGYWPARLHRGGRVLVPTTAGRYVQVIDVTDLATWIVQAGRRGFTGTVNAVGESHSFDAFLADVAAVTGFKGEFVVVEDEFLLDHDVRFWGGPRSLPLWLPLVDAAMAQRDLDTFLASEGTIRPLRDTIARVLDDEISRGATRARRAGLTAEDEADLVDRIGPTERSG